MGSGTLYRQLFHLCVVLSLELALLHSEKGSEDGRESSSMHQLGHVVQRQNEGLPAVAQQQRTLYIAGKSCPASRNVVLMDPPVTSSIHVAGL